jgi:hypothetical protein
LAAWNSQLREPKGIIETTALAECMAAAGDERALRWITLLRAYQPVEADAILARLRFRQGKPAEAATAMISAFTRFQKDPWAMRLTMRRAIPLSVHIARNNPAIAKSLFESLRTPFAVRAQDENRRQALFELALQSGDSTLMVEALKTYEPFVPWHQEFLTERLNIYVNTKHAMKGRALADLAEYQKGHADNPLRELMVKSAQSQGGATAQIEKN